MRLLTKEQKKKMKELALKYEMMKDFASSIRLPKETGEWDDPTSKDAIKAVIYEELTKAIEEAAVEAAGQVLAPYILEGVTTRTNYDNLRLVKGMPCGYRQYYDYREEFYICLAKRTYVLLEGGYRL